MCNVCVHYFCCCCSFACFSLPIHWYSDTSLVTQIDGKKCGIFISAYVVIFFLLLSLWFRLPYTESQLVLLSLYLRSSNTTFHMRRIVHKIKKKESELSNRIHQRKNYFFSYIDSAPENFWKMQIAVIVKSARPLSKSTAIRIDRCFGLIWCVQKFPLSQFLFDSIALFCIFFLRWANEFVGIFIDIRYYFFPSAMLSLLSVLSLKRSHNFATNSIGQ